MSNELTLLVGTYTAGGEFVPGACGEGIVTCAFDSETGHFTRRAAFADIVNPSYLAWDSANGAVFAVSENFHADGAVWQFSLGNDGQLTPLGQHTARGAACCHVAILPGNQIAAASYFGGCTTIFPLSGGTLGTAERVITYEGRGANPQRQEASHAHQTVVSPNEKWFYVCDLGADRVWQHDPAVLEREPIGHAMPAGLGPRHLVFHPSLRRAFVLGELSGSIAICDWHPETGRLTVTSTTDPVEENAAAAAIRIHSSASALWISLRTHPALLVFPLDAHGNPGPATTISLTAGEPRDFIISPDGRWLIVATQSANELVVIGLDSATGQPNDSPHQKFHLNTPVSLLII